MSILTKEVIQKILNDDWLLMDDCEGLENCTVIKELARIALTALDSEPVAYTDERNLGYIDRGRETAYLWGKQNSEASDVALYRHAQPAPEREQVRHEHAEWSQEKFGNVGPVGPLKHLSKEALEAADQPGDLSEWADMQFLMWDAQRRAGITDEQITQAMFDKLAVNKRRSWPEPKDGEPRLHIKEQPAPVVPAVSDDIGEIRVGRLPTMNQDDYPGLGDWWVQLRIGEDSDEVLARVYGATPQEANNRAEALACRAAMLQAQPQNAPQNIPEIIPDCWCRTCRPVVLSDMRFVVCPDCGNKRCPRANDHRNACTGSNEPGQEGSAYPAAPQEVTNGK